MKFKKLRFKSALSVILAASILASVTITAVTASAADISPAPGISYSFTGEEADKAGYAEGTVTFATEENGTYNLYWADNEKALEGYYAITTAEITDDVKSVEFNFGYHTAIPADATKIIAVKDEEGAVNTVANAYAVYDVPADKVLPYTSEQASYTFNSYSDIHIDQLANSGGYKYSELHFKEALQYSANKGVDFIITSGDNITNTSGYTKEWDMYQTILAESDYVNPIYESCGNHEIRKGTVDEGTGVFSIATGVDNTEEAIAENKGYYYVKEPKTGDLFIFMTLEGGFAPNQVDEFTDEQLQWASDLIAENYGKCNIYVIQHALIKGYGAGDYNDSPIYGGGITQYFLSTVKFKNMLEKYPDIVWISGHTHQAYSLEHNYSNENGTSCNMIHNSSVGCPTYPNSSVTSQVYNHSVSNSEGYYVQVFDGKMIFSGANLHDQLIFPAYSYIIEGSRYSDPEATNATVEPTTLPAETGSVLDPEAVTNRFYFVNTLDWEAVDCYAWSGNANNKWPGYACTYIKDNEDGHGIYYVDIPKQFKYVIFNDANRGNQTVDVSIGFTNGKNMFIAADKINSSGKVNVTKDVYVEDTTEPIETTVPVTTEPVTTEPVTTEPTTTVPVTTEQPETTEPITTEPVTTEPITTEPVTTEPITTEPITTEPITTEPITEPVLLGDANADGKININDATAIQKYAAELGEVDMEASDVNFDGRVNVKDATEIQKKIAGIIEDFTKPENTDKITAETGATDLATELASAKTVLDENYKFSSYDQYQALKKVYYAYKDADLTALTDEQSAAVCSELTTCTDKLNAIVAFVNTLLSAA